MEKLFENKVAFVTGGASGLLRQSEMYLDRSLDFDRVAIQEGWLVDPLAHGVEGCLNEQRVTFYYMQLLHRSICCNDPKQLHCALNAGLLCQGRINRYHLPDDLRSLNVTAHDDVFDRFRRGRRFRVRRFGRWRHGGVDGKRQHRAARCCRSR